MIKFTEMKQLILRNKFEHSYDPDKIYEAEYNFFIQKNTKTSEFAPPIIKRFCENSDYDIKKHCKLKQGQTIKSVQVKLLKEIGVRNKY
jgi:hypothetical protein